MRMSSVSPVVVLTLFLQLACMLRFVNSTLCELLTIRELAKTPMRGGWFAAEPSGTSTVDLMRAAVIRSQAGNSATAVTKEQHALEAYHQVVGGTNYCIRFSASGDCNSYYCKSYECIASGHRPLTSEGFTSVSVECSMPNVCEIERVSEISKTPMPGGWRVAPLNDEHVARVQLTSSKIATVGKGSIVEAYQQTVAGYNYCIRFTAQATASNCGQHCQPLICVASGHDPLPMEHANPTYTTKIAVSCRATEAGALRGGSSFSGGNRLTSAAAPLAIALSLITVILSTK